jgi:short-subunit dehydrogenase
MSLENTSTQKPLSVVTGASMGIGFELAHQFASNGFDLIICSESENILLAQKKLQATGAQVNCVQADLASFTGVEDLAEAIRQDGRPLEALAINAGVGVGGDFTETELREEINLINLNIVSAVHLTKCVLKDMYQRGKGRILFTSSIASVMPAPFEAVYGASKAFLTSFAEAIRNEASDHGVSVTILMPSPTNTNFFDRAKLDDTQAGSEEKYENDPRDVAKQGFDALMAGEEKVVAASLKTKLQGWASKVLPESTKANFHRKLSEPGSAKH